MDENPAKRKTAAYVASSCDSAKRMQCVIRTTETVGSFSLWDVAEK